MILLSATLCGSSGIVFGVIYWSGIFASGVSFRHVEEPPLILLSATLCGISGIVFGVIYWYRHGRKLIVTKKKACCDQDESL